MKNAATVIAIDLGAESGRISAVLFDGARISFRLVRRFATMATSPDAPPVLDFPRVLEEIKAGLSEVGHDTQVVSVGADTWGLDFGLVGADLSLIAPPVFYRDSRRTSAYFRTLRSVDPAYLYDRTGIQVMPINTLFGLIAERDDERDALPRASKMLMIPDLIHLALTGCASTERSSAATTAMVDIATGKWSTALLDALELPTHILPEILPSGTDIGPVRGKLAETGLKGTRVILPACHDSASAASSVTLPDDGTFFISSGTWSVVGVATSRPVVNANSRLANLSNEGGHAGSYRLVRNVSGLWMLQECRREWQAAGLDLTYEELANLAATVSPLRSIVDPFDPVFIGPGNMTSRIAEFCRRAGAYEPQTPAEFVRTIIDSLALGYRLVLDDIVKAADIPITRVVVGGGGTNNRPLQQATANATGLPVWLAETEASTIGNGLVQLTALGEFGSLAEAQACLGTIGSSPAFIPTDEATWSEAADTLRQISRSRQTV
jgi:rhamnulokinase